MQRSVVYVCILVCLAGAACSGGAGAGTESNENANTGFVSLPQFTDANVALAEGSKFLDVGETDKAIDALSQAVALDPLLAEAWFKLGIAYGLAEKRDELLAKASTDAEQESTEKSGRAKTNSEKAFEKAVTTYKKIIDANDENDAAYFNLGRAYNKLNKDEDAAKALKQAVKLKADDTDYQTELGAILIKLAQYHEAIPPLKKALELDPENIRAQELMEDAEAGRKRVNYSATPKDDRKPSNTSNNSNTNSASPPGGKPPPPPGTGSPKPRPTASRQGD